MTEEIIINVSNCPHKMDDDCMEVPICNEYGDLMGYQSCEAQTLCPYRSQKKIERLEQLKNKYYQQTLDDEITISDLITKCNDLEQKNKELKEEIQFHNKENSNLLAERNALQIGYDEIREVRERYRSALEEIREIVELAYYSKGMPEEPLSQRDFILDVINNYEQRRIKILTKTNEVLK